MAVKHRCGFCRKILRSDGTCANEECPRYVSQEDNIPQEDNKNEGKENVR